MSRKGRQTHVHLSASAHAFARAPEQGDVLGKQPQGDQGVSCTLAGCLSLASTHNGQPAQTSKTPQASPGHQCSTHSPGVPQRPEMTPSAFFPDPRPSLRLPRRRSYETSKHGGKVRNWTSERTPHTPPPPVPNTQSRI